MALPVLDGNQSATTLSSVVTGGEHIVAHSVVCLGSTAIANITNAVSGSVVSISNFPSTQTIAGTVTANLANVVTNDIFYFVPAVRVMGTGNDGVILQGIDANSAQANVFEGGAIPVVGRNNDPVAISGTVTVGNSVTIGSLPTISGTVTANVGNPVNASGQVIIDRTVGLSYICENQVSQAEAGVAVIYNDSTNQTQIVGSDYPFPISGTVTVGNSVTIGSLPAISGTVTANGGNFLNADNALITKDSATNVILLGGLAYSTTPTLSQIQALQTFGTGVLKVYQEETNWTDTNQGNQTRKASQQTPFPVQILGGSVTIGSLPEISGTVTANTEFASEEFSTASKAIQIGYKNTAPDFVFVEEGNHNFPVKIFTSDGVVGGGNASVPISGTVTAAAPNGSLTTRFGTPTTANVSFATSAVTNANRKYLLIQNVTTGSNVITVGIGFTPTTTQGIQLTAGAGITFESSYIPTGQIFVLSSVTASNFTILEA